MRGILLGAAEEADENCMAMVACWRDRRVSIQDGERILDILRSARDIGNSDLRRASAEQMHTAGFCPAETLLIFPTVEIVDAAPCQTERHVRRCMGHADNAPSMGLVQCHDCRGQCQSAAGM